MKIQYFKSAWGDIKNSPGWFGKMCLLGLLNFIPIFGQIVTFAYLYGWAREIAWGTHQPMPAKIFSNEDGKFWRRGWFVLVLTVVFALVPYIIMMIGSMLQAAGSVNAMQMYAYGARGYSNPVFGIGGGLISLVGWVALFLCCILSWIGAMRISIYDRLSAGFQLGKIWKMLRRDTGGILRIFGMSLLVSLIISIILFILFFALIMLVVMVGVAGFAASGYDISAMQHMTSAQSTQLAVSLLVSAGLVGFLAFMLCMFITMVFSVFVNMLVIRAMGYWTMQFDVPQWAGQDDPLPFESEEQPAAAAPVAPIAPTAPTAAQPVQPAQPAQPVQPAAPAAPAQPAAPAAPAAPSAPAEPAAPVAPAEPAAPAAPAQPQAQNDKKPSWSQATAQADVPPSSDQQ